MYEIESNIPIPEGDTDPRGRKRKYPFADMEVGDSFFVPSDQATNHKVRQRASEYGSRLRMKFRTYVADGGTRVFRIE